MGIRGVMLTVILLLSSSLLYAQGDTCHVQPAHYAELRDVMKAVIELKNQGCYGEAKDPTSWVATLNQQLNRLGKQPIAAIRHQISEALATVDRQLASEPSNPPLNHLKQNLAPLVRYLPAIDMQAPPAGLRANDWRFDARYNAIHLGNDDKVELKPLLAQDCSRQPVDWAQCEPSVRTVEGLLRYWGAVSRIIWAYNKPNGQQTLQALELLDKRWDAYYYQARPQNFLEVGFNSWRFNSDTQGQDGFLSPPDYQWIVMHPNIAMEYINNAPDGSSFRESLVLELVGRNSWTWQDSKMQRPLGWSIIAAYSDRAGVNDLGWGMMVHINHVYSFGVTRHGNHTGALISLDLLRFFGGWSQGNKEKFNLRR